MRQDITKIREDTGGQNQVVSNIRTFHHFRYMLIAV